MEYSAKSNEMNRGTVLQRTFICRFIDIFRVNMGLENKNKKKDKASFLIKFLVDTRGHRAKF